MRRIFTLFVVLVLLLGGRASRAEDAEQARAHFANGVRLYDAQNYQGALDEFRAAYAAKASPGIKRNIALCLKGMRRYPEAIDALEELVKEGGDALKPEVRDGAKRTIVELRALVAMARLRVMYGGRATPPHVAVTLDGQAVPPAKLAEPLYVMPGDHVFVARAPGYFDAETRAKLAAGHENTIDLEMVAMEIVARGRLNVRTNVTLAQIAIDGIGVGQGEWFGDVPVGSHRLDVTAAGYRPHAVDVVVAASEARDVMVDMTSVPENVAVFMPVRTPREWYVSGGLGLFGQSVRFTPALQDKESSRHGVGGGGLVAHFGRHVGPLLSVGVLGEVGGMAARQYTSDFDPTMRVTVSMTNYALAPELRLRTRGKLRAIGGIALGLEGQYVTATLGPTKVAGGGTSAMGLVEGGGQFEMGRIFFEAALFADVHGIGTPTSDRGRLFEDAPTVRAGLRAVVGYAF